MSLTSYRAPSTERWTVSAVVPGFAMARQMSAWPSSFGLCHKPGEAGYSTAKHFGLVK